MKLIKHVRNGKNPRWKVVSGEYTISATTAQLESQARFISAATRQSLNHQDPPEHAAAFRALTKPMGRMEWTAAVNELLAGVQTVQD
jgi:hypothetical protein